MPICKRKPTLTAAAISAKAARDLIILECQTELAFNFARPARQIIGTYADRLGLTTDALIKIMRDQCE